MIDLLACPFCGGRATRQDIEYDTMGAEPSDENYGGSFIECDGCGACTHVEFGFKENLESSWNRRTPQCGYSCNGVNLHGDKPSIDAAYEAFHSHDQIEDLRRNLRHWREECGKLHAKLDRSGDAATKYEELFQAVSAYQDFLKRSVNVGPLTKNPSKEAALLRKLWELVPA